MLEPIAQRLEVLQGPLGQRLRQAFSSAISDGSLRANATLPSERDIAASLGISRTTVRSCLKDLAEQGLVTTRHGAGTVVSGPIPKALSRLSGFTEDMTARGLEPSTIVLGREITDITPDQALRLALPLGTRMMTLTRLRRANDEALSYERAAVPLAAVGEDYDGTGSLYARMAERDCRPRRSLQTLQAIGAPAEIAHHLELAENAPVLRISQVSYDERGAAVEDASTWYRGDRYRYVGEVRS